VFGLHEDYDTVVFLDADVLGLPPTLLSLSLPPPPHHPLSPLMMYLQRFVCIESRTQDAGVLACSLSCLHALSLAPLGMLVLSLPLPHACSLSLSPPPSHTHTHISLSFSLSLSHTHTYKSQCSGSAHPVFYPMFFFVVFLSGVVLVSQCPPPLLCFAAV
jgi:hypothetical protein